VAELLIEKGLITRDEFMQKLSAMRETYQSILERAKKRNQLRLRSRDRTALLNERPVAIAVGNTGWAPFGAVIAG
jgi:hypothetical protein